MGTALTILNLINLALAILKQIPETAAIANEVSALENSLVSVVSAANQAKKQADQSVDPSTLSTIDPVA